MSIKIIEEIVVPEKKFNKLRLSFFSIAAPFTGGEARAEVHLIPYNDAGDSLPEMRKVLFIEDIFARPVDSKIATAYGALLDAIDEEYKLLNQRSRKA
jgi:hypothetical protein